MSNKEKFAIQLHSVKEELAKDCENTIKNLKEIGFNAIQIDDTCETPKQDIAKILKKYDIKITGIHIKHERFFNNIDGIVQDAELFDTKNIFDKYIDDEYQSKEGYRFTRNTLRIIARQLKPMGYRIGIHNSIHDFNKTVDGKKIMEFMTEPKNNMQIYPEFDTYWISIAGFNPVSYIRNYTNQIHSIHLKDFKLGFNSYDINNNLVNLGEGTVDFLSIMQWGEKNGIESYIVEHNPSQKNVFDNLETNFQYLRQLSEKVLT